MFVQWYPKCIGAPYDLCIILAHLHRIGSYDWAYYNWGEGGNFAFKPEVRDPWQTQDLVKIGQTLKTGLMACF